jgi:uncharacterized protein YggT (Ycf19 family)
MLQPRRPMTYPTDDTDVVERERIVERERPVAPVAPANPGGQVNVNADRGGYVATGPGPLYYARRVVALLFGILFVLLILRIVLLALGANEGNGIVDGIYGVTEPFVAPFRGVFTLDEIRPIGRSVFDVAALVALIGWVLIELLILAILNIGDRTRTTA